MTTTNGLIILGNTGAGKSFIGNLILNREAFVHECNVDSVTHNTEFCEFSEGPIQFSIFNIPGLIENEQAAVERNKVEIHKAFGIRPNSIVAFVFTAGAGGRITGRYYCISCNQEGLFVWIQEFPRNSQRFASKSATELRHGCKSEARKISRSSKHRGLLPSSNQPTGSGGPERTTSETACLYQKTHNQTTS
mgnify:FL=1